MTFLGPTGTQIGKTESMKDTARVPGQVYDAIEYCGFGQILAEELAQCSGVPVYNGLSRLGHAVASRDPPCAAAGSGRVGLCRRLDGARGRDRLCLRLPGIGRLEDARAILDGAAGALVSGGR